MNKRFLVFTAVLSIFAASFAAFASPVHAYYMTFYTNNTLNPMQNATVVGQFHTVTASETIPLLHVNASFPNGNLTNGGLAMNVSTNESFTLYVNTSDDAEYNLSTDDQTLTIITNNTSMSVKTADVRLTNVSSATIEFVENLPPFFLGTKIIAKVTATGTDGLALASENISAKIYAADGAQPIWGNNASVTDSDGIAYINFTIPSNASSGTYILSLENGVATSIFVIKQYTVTLKTKDTSGADKSKFAPADQVTIETAITSNGNPTDVDSVSCEFIDANNLVTNVTGTNTSTGTYQCNLTTSSTAQTYNVRVTTTQSSASQVTYTTFATQSFSVRLAPRSGMGFFKEFGGKKSFTIGQTVQMDIIVTNVSSGELYVAGTDYNCTGNVTIDDMWFASNGTSVNSTIDAGDTFNTGMFMMTSGCYYQFSIGQLTGVFGIRVNVTDNSDNTVQGQGYLSINKYLLKVEPSNIFGGMDFHVLLKPENNASFKITAYNLTDGSELELGNITDAGVTKITPLMFTTGISEHSEENINYSYVNGTTKYLNVQLPADTGPQLLNAWATVGPDYENVTGEAFYFAKYLMGFAGPSGNIFGAGGEQEGPGEGGPPTGGTITCTVGKTIEFTAQTMDASTMQPVKGVNFLGILEGRNEMTGQSVTHCFDATSATSDTNGQATFNFTFQSGSGCSDLSGYYFVIFNVSWKEKTDEIPAFFECRQMNINPSAEPWDAQATSTIEINVSNATYSNGSNVVVEAGNISFVSLMNFNPNMGGQVLTANTNYLNGSIQEDTKQGSNYFTGTLKLNPANFTVGGKNLTKWPNGFYDGQVRICDSNDNECDVGMFGFSIQPFRAYTTWWEESTGESVYAAGDEVTTTIFAQTNISRNESAPGDWTNETQNYTDSLGFDIKIMSPDSQADYTITNFTFTNTIEDSDSKTQWMAQENWQKWNASFQLPATLPKGWYMGFMTVNNTNGSTVDMFVDFRVRSYVVGIPHKEKLSGDASVLGCDDVAAVNCTLNAANDAESVLCEPLWTSKSQAEILGNWSGVNLTYISNNFGVDVSGNGEVCIFKHFYLTAEDSQSGANVSNNTHYGVLVFGNSSHKMLFLKNDTDDIFQLNATENVPGTKQYLVKVEGPWYAVFINATNTTSRSDGGFMQTTWGWAGQFEVGTNFTIPFMVTKSDQAQSGINVTIENMVQLETAGFGVVGMLDSSNYTTNINGIVGNVTDANGIAWVPLNVTQVGKFKPFWKLNNSAGDTGSFDRSPVIDIISFKTWGQFVHLLPQGGNNVTLYARDGNTNYLESDCPSSTYHPANESIYFNGTFEEQAGSELIADGRLDTWYFMLANSTTSYDTLYIDNDTLGNISVNGDDTWGSTSSMTAITERSIDIGSTMYYIAEHYIDSVTTNTSKIVFYDELSVDDQSTITSANQKVPVKLCGQSFQYRGLNTTISLQYVNWMSTIGPPIARDMNIYNVTTGAQTDNINTSSLWNSGCVVVKVLPNSSSWETGITEITGSVQQLDSSGDPTGELHQIWAGQVMR